MFDSDYMNTSDEKFLFKLVGAISAGLIAVALIVTGAISLFQFHVVLPAEAYYSLKKDPWKDVNAQLMTFRGHHDFERAEHALLSSIKTNPNDSPVPYYLLASLYDLWGKPEESRNYYMECLKQVRSHWYHQTVYQYLAQDAAAALALNYYENNDRESAIRYLDQAGNLEGHRDAYLLTALKNVLQSPDRADYHYDLGQELRHILKVELARKELETALKLSTDPSFRLKVHGVLATSMPATVTQLDPMARYYNLAGDSHESEGQNLSLAARFYEKAIQETPDFEWPYHHLGLVHREMKQYSQAKKYALKAVELNPNFYLAYLTLGDIELDRENYASAIHHFTQARSILMKHRDDYHQSLLANIENQLGFSYEILRDNDNAERHYNLALENTAISAEDYDYASEAVERMQDLKRTSKHLYTSVH